MWKGKCLLIIEGIKPVYLLCLCLIRPSPLFFYCLDVAGGVVGLSKPEEYANMESSTTTWANEPLMRAVMHSILKLISVSFPKVSALVMKHTEVSFNGWLVSSSGLTGSKNMMSMVGTTLRSSRSLSMEGIPTFPSLIP